MKEVYIYSVKGLFGPTRFGIHSTWGDQLEAICKNFDNIEIVSKDGMVAQTTTLPGKVLFFIGRGVSFRDMLGIEIVRVQWAAKPKVLYEGKLLQSNKDYECYFRFGVGAREGRDASVLYFLEYSNDVSTLAAVCVLSLLGYFEAHQG